LRWVFLVSAIGRRSSWFCRTERYVSACAEREFFIDNLQVRVHVIIVMIKWTGLAMGPHRKVRQSLRPMGGQHSLLYYS